jgi:rhomboid protease GluP
VLKRQRTGSVLCTSCGVLVGVNDATCYNCGRRNPGLWGYAPAVRALGNDLGFMPFIVGTCAIIYVLSLVMSGGQLGQLGSPASAALFMLGESGALPFWGYHRWWTVLSATWLHGNAIHILFNMLWVRQLVPATAELYGPGRTVIIYTAGGVVGFLLTSTIRAFLPPIPIFSGAYYTVGASAAIFGLLGAVVYYGRRTGSQVASSQGWYYVVVAGAMGLFMQGVDNSAHLGGFAGGYLTARLLDPLTHERVDHLIIAVVCIAASLLSIALSVYTALPIFR